MILEMMSDQQPPPYYPPSASHINAFPGVALTRRASLASTILPQYNAGGRVTQTAHNGGIQNVVSFQISKSQPYYDIGDVIHGTIVFSPRTETKITSIGILLRGVETTNKSGWTSEKMIKRSFVVCHHTIPPDALPENKICFPGFTYSYPFSIIVPDLLPFSEPSCCKEGIPTHYRLPPSLGSPPQQQERILDVPNNAARITYSVEAYAKGPITKTRPSSFISQYVKYIRLSPSYNPSPVSLSPRSPALLQAQSAIKRGLLKRSSSGNITAIALAAPVLALRDPALTTSVPVRITYTSLNNASSVPPKVTKVYTTILSITNYSTKAPLLPDSSGGSPPKLASTTSEDNNILVDTQKASTTRLDFSLNQATWIPDVFNDLAYTTTIDLPVALSSDLDWIPPTFESCYISRKYIVEFTITFVSGQTVTVETPLNLLASFVSRSNMPFDLEPHQYPFPTAAKRRNSSEPSVVLDVIPGLSLDSLPQNTPPNLRESSQELERRRLQKTPAFTRRRPS